MARPQKDPSGTDSLMSSAQFPVRRTGSPFSGNRGGGGIQTIKEAIIKIVDKQDLTYEEAYQVMDEMLSGETSPIQNAAYLSALSAKNTKAGTTDEIAGSAAAMRDHATPFPAFEGTLDIAGTGGDGSGSFNISTAASIIAAASGARVAKSGCRAVSSRCGSADVMEALGTGISQSPEKAASLLGDLGMCFLCSHDYHPSLRFVGSIRKHLGIRTVFNVLGPLTNPSGPSYSVLGVYDLPLLEPLARVMSSLGAERGMTVFGKDRIDEISVSDETYVCEFSAKGTETYMISPEDFGFRRSPRSEIVGGTPEENAGIIIGILSGKKGARRDIAVMNAAAGIYCAGRAGSLAEGAEIAENLIDGGEAMALLERYRKASFRCLLSPPFPEESERNRMGETVRLSLLCSLTGNSAATWMRPAALSGIPLPYERS